MPESRSDRLCRHLALDAAVCPHLECKSDRDAVPHRPDQHGNEDASERPDDLSSWAHDRLESRDVPCGSGARVGAGEAVEALPDQPDGIEGDTFDLPDLARAVERVREFVKASGDGLYDVVEGRPLYARDLEALTRAASNREGHRRVAFRPMAVDEEVRDDWPDAASGGEAQS